jgi:hypothetical protein
MREIRIAKQGFTSFESSTEPCAQPAPWNGCKVGSTAGAERDGRATGKVALDYTLNEDNLLYGGAPGPVRLFRRRRDGAFSQAA